MARASKATSKRMALVGGFLALVLLGVGSLSAQDTVEARLAALESRIRELERELAVARGKAAEPTLLPVHSEASQLEEAFVRPAVLTTPARLETMSVAAAASPAAASALPPQTDALSGDLEGLNFFKGVTFSGFVDGYYSYNFNQPADRSVGLRNFDFHSNSFSLNLGELSLKREATDSSPLGFQLTYGFGPAADVVNGADPGFTADNFFQYYLSGKVGGVTLDFGKFVTIHGAEVIETGTNFNYSRGFLFGLAIPFYHFGLRATIPVSETFTLTGLLVNGWDNVRDNNSGKTLGVLTNWTPNERFSLVQNYMTGPETSDDPDLGLTYNDTFRHLFDTVVTVNLNDHFTFVTNFDYGMDRDFSADPVKGAHVHWVGFANYLRMRSGNFALTPRFEFFSDPMGFRTGSRQQLKSFTLTPEFTINEYLLTRLEYRHDWSNADAFPVGDDPGDNPRKQNTALVGFILNF